MPMPKKIKKESVQPKPEIKPKEFKRDSVTLRVKGQNQRRLEIGFTRTFSRADHGDEFEFKAEEWKKIFNAEEVN